MTFICTVAEGETQFERLSNASEDVVIAQVGHDDANGSSFSIFTAFSPLPGGITEHVFSLHRAHQGDIVEMWDGAETRHWIPDRAVRQVLLEVLCAATGLLIEVRKPPFVVHATYTAGMPTKALHKHWTIMKVFEDAGYEVRTPDEYHGRRLWHATLTTSAS